MRVWRQGEDSLQLDRLDLLLQVHLTLNWLLVSESEVQAGESQFRYQCGNYSLLGGCTGSVICQQTNHCTTTLEKMPWVGRIGWKSK